jgi:myosin heavy subunit
MAAALKAARFNQKRNPKNDSPEWIQAILTSPVGIEDMVLLPNADVKGIVSNLEMRLKKDCIYTYIGHVLCVCNPYKWLSIYDDATIKFYTHKQRIDAPPHIFGVAEAVSDDFFLSFFLGSLITFAFFFFFLTCCVVIGP